MGSFRSWPRWAFAVLAVAASTSPLAARVLPFEVFGLKEGLPQSQVVALAQDADGYLWVGTWGGLARFNGEEFTSFFAGQGLPSSRVQELLLDTRGWLWVATAGGVSVWRDHTLTALEQPLLANVRARALAEDGEGRIWVGTDAGAVVLAAGPAGAARRPDGAEVAGEPIVHDLLADGDGVLAVTSAGLLRFPRGRKPEWQPGPTTPAGGLRNATRTAEGLWVGTLTDGLFLLDEKGWRRVPAREVGGRYVYRTSLGRSGALYVATNDAGLYRKPAGASSFERWDTASGLPSNVANCAFEDREGNVWVGTDIGGLARLGGLAVANYGEREGFPSSCVFGITGGATPDSLWVATLRGAVHVRVRPSEEILETVRAAQGLINEWVWKVVPFGDELWLLNDTELVVRRARERRFSSPPPGVPIPRSAPHDVLVDLAGRLWVSGEDPERNLAMRDPRAGWRSWAVRSAAGAPVICRALAPRRAGGVWVATSAGLAECDGTDVRYPVEQPALPAGAYTSIVLEDRAGRLWAGSDGGLAVRAPGGGWTSFESSSAVGGLQAYALGEDLEGSVWVGTSRGFFRLKADGSIEPFGLEEGLASLEANSHGFFVDPTGEVWLGTVAGMSRYDARRRVPNPVSPAIVVEAVELPGRRVAFPAGLDLSWRERSATFRIDVLAFRSRRAGAFRARMEGLEDEWLPPRRPGELRYTNLPAGSHRLLLQAANESGVWSRVVALPIRVRPPFWLTLPFRLAVLALLGAGVAGVVAWRTAHLRRANRELELAVAQRTEELREANAELERLATHEPLTGLPNRRAIVETLRAELPPRGGRGRAFGCVLVDLDRFKAVNDTLGHAAGDRVLRAMAEQIRSCLREGDHVGRYGGDEFLVVLPGAVLEAVDAVARKISQLSTSEADGERVLTVTASCGGVAVAGGDVAGEAAVLAAADGLMYEVKRAGRQGYRVRAFATGGGPA